MNRFSYSKYQYSGVEWLGEVPEHWEVKPLKHSVLFKEGPGIMADDFMDEGVPLLRISCIGSRFATLNGCNFLSPELVASKWAHFQTRVGDLLISGSASTGLCSEVDTSTEKAIPYTGIIILRPKTSEVEKNFLRWFFLSDKFQIQVSLASTGSTIQHFGPSHLSTMLMVLPSLDEQTKIAAFLDYETSRLNHLVAKQERLIELLNEKRQGIINHVVTHGIDSNPTLKDSSVEWLGQVPQHWEVVRLKFLSTKIGSGKTPLGGAANYESSGIPLIRSQNVHFNGLNLNDVVYISSETDASMSNSRVIKNDVLLNITGASIGRCCVVPHDFEHKGQHSANVNQHVCIIRPSRRINSHFLRFVLSSGVGQTQVFNSENGISREGLTFEQIGNFLLLLPPIEEQLGIVHYLECELTKIDSLIAKAKQAINLMKEHRTSLISAAVTGKIDVRSL